MSTEKTINDWTRKELLSLPMRKFDNTKTQYDTLLIFGDGRKHESGWAVITIVGCREYKPIEICTQCSDDIEWKLPSMKYTGKYSMGQMRSDMAFKSKALHVWMREHVFAVGTALSSVDITMIPKP